MKKWLIILFTVITCGLHGQVDSVWQAYYDSTDATWGNDWGKTEQLLTDAKIYLENTLSNPESDSTYNLTLNDLGICYQYMDRFEEALLLLEAALENTAASLGKQHSEYGVHLNNLGQVYKFMGRYEEALPLLEEALENTATSLGKQHAGYGSSLNNLGLCYQSMGRYVEALSLLESALENTAASLGKQHSLYGIELGNIGNLYQMIGHYEEALPLLEEAREIIVASLGKQHSEYGILLNNLGMLYENMGHYEEALPLMEEALENTAASLGKQHSEYGNRLNNLAGLFKSMGRYEEALSLYLESQETAVASLGKQHAHYGILLINMGHLYKSMGRYEEALPLYVEANANLAGQIEQIFSISSEKNKQDFLKTIISKFHEYQSFAFSSDYQFDSLNFMLYNNSLWQKGFVLSSITQTTKAILESGDSVLLTKFEDWKNLRNQLARQYSKPIAKRLAGLDSLEQLANQWEEDLVRGSKEFETIRKKVSWSDVRNQLSDGEAAIEFVHFRYSDKKTTDSTLYAAMILTTDYNRPEIIPLFEEKQLSNLLAERATAFSNLAINDIYRGAKPLVTGGVTSEAGLYDLIWKPFENYLKDVETVYFVPSGQLHQLAVSAIPHPEGGNLSDHYNLIELTSTRNLAIGRKAPEHQSISLLGGIEFDIEPQFADTDMLNEAESLLAIVSNSAQRSALLDKFTYLPGTQTEVQQIQTLFEQNQSTTNLLTGQNATEAAFKSLSGNSPDVIHIATHGFFFPDVEYTADEIERGAAFKYIDNPMFRAGLAFAGANYTWEHGYNPFEEEDGILTAYEISNMDLSNTDLVVLSACETGLGEIKGSEGVFGLQRAFKMAGVDYLMMSLWQVPDKETSEFMVMFYENWLGGMEIREAFRETQLVMSKRYEGEPYKWAAFVLVE